MVLQAANRDLGTVGVEEIQIPAPLREKRNPMRVDASTNQAVFSLSCRADMVLQAAWTGIEALSLCNNVKHSCMRSTMP